MLIGLTSQDNRYILAIIVWRRICLAIDLLKSAYSGCPQGLCHHFGESNEVHFRYRSLTSAFNFAFYSSINKLFVAAN